MSSSRINCEAQVAAELDYLAAIDIGSCRNAVMFTNISLLFLPRCVNRRPLAKAVFLHGPSTSAGLLRRPLYIAFVYILAGWNR